MGNNAQIGTGLRPLPRDPRDFSLAGVFGQEDISVVPDEDFVVAEPQVIKDQKETEFCTAYAVTAVSEDQEGVVLYPDWQFAKIKQIEGNKETWGATLRDAAKSVVKFGSVEMNDRELSYERDKVVDWENYPSYLEREAQKHRKKSFFNVDGGYDTFDNIRLALWQNRDKNRSVLIGCQWRHAWNGVEDGVIPEEYELEPYTGHAFKIYGQKMIDGKPHLIAQLSNGEEVGDRGRFYFPRFVINREVAGFGKFMFKDMPKEAARSANASPITGDTPAKMTVSIVVGFIKRLFTLDF